MDLPVALAPGVAGRVLGPDAAEFWSRDAVRRWSGRGVGLVLERLDGRRTGSAIAASLAGRIEAAEVYYAISRLRARRLVVEGPCAPETARLPLTGRLRFHTEAGGLVTICRAEAAMPLPGQGRLAVCGSGLSREAAERAATGEAAERYSLHFQPSLEVTRGAWETLVERAIHPSRFLLHSPRQLRLRRGGGYQLSDRTAWVAARSLTRGEPCLVPAACCYFSYPQADGGGPLLKTSTSGCAAGPDWDSAVVRAFLEAVERDAIAIWWYNRLPRPALPAPAPLGTALAEALAGENWRLTLLDLTTDLGIPVVAAVARPQKRPRDGARLGFGAAWDRDNAAIKAILELCQSLAWPEFQIGGQPVNAPWILAAANRTGASGRSARPISTAGVAACIGTATSAGLDLLVVNHTRPETGTAVARVIVPGLRPSAPRFAAGRLYDVPESLGWLPKALTEESLNPVTFDL